MQTAKMMNEHFSISGGVCTLGKRGARGRGHPAAAAAAAAAER